MSKYSNTMERRAFHHLFLAVSGFVTIFVAVKGFHTETCDHQSLASNVKSVAICIDKAQLASVKDIVKSTEGEAEQKKSLDLKSFLRITQKTVPGVLECMNVFCKACFQTDIAGFIVLVVSQFLAVCFKANLSIYPKWINSEKVWPGGFGEWNATSWRFVDFYFDKECTWDELYREMHFEVINCFRNVFDGDYPYPSNAPTLCDATKIGINSCMKENRCFSKQEMDLLRDLTATIHTMVMEDLVRLNEKFGNFSLTLEALVTAIEPQARKTDYQTIDNYNYLMDAAVDDFKIGSACQKTLMEYSMISNSPRVLPLMSMISNSPRVLPLMTLIYFITLTLFLSKLTNISFAHL